MEDVRLRDSDRTHRLLVLDDEALYNNSDEDWARVFLRLPLLPDALPYYGGDAEKDEISMEKFRLEEESYMPLFNASLKDKQAIYLIDEQALRESLVKILYLDVHGNAVWNNKISPEGLEVFEAFYTKGSTLARIHEKCDLGEPSLLQPGALLEYDV